MLMKVSLKLATGCKEEEMAELLAVIPGVQLVGQRSSWLNYRYSVSGTPILMAIGESLGGLSRALSRTIHSEERLKLAGYQIN